MLIEFESAKEKNYMLGHEKTKAEPGNDRGDYRLEKFDMIQAIKSVIFIVDVSILK
jgi:hypothetical protein